MNWKKNLFSAFLLAAEAFCLYFLLVIPAEYLLTEKFLVFKFITTRAKTNIFLGLVIFLALAHRGGKVLYSWERRYWPLILAIFIAFLPLSRRYARFYQDLQRYPKIYKISSDWSIVGMEITIEGKNFGPAWQKGEVYVDDFKLLTSPENWSEEKIIAIQPLPPRYFTGEIYVKKANGLESNRLPFKIRDPRELDNP